MKSTPFPGRFKSDHRQTCETVRDMLAQVMTRPPSLATVMRWSGDQREHAMEWAGRAMLHASDNPVRRIALPPFLNHDDVYGLTPAPETRATASRPEGTQ